MLRDLAYAMRTSLRRFSLLYRVGGEEFVVVLPGVALAEGKQVAERLRQAVAHRRPGGIPVTMSIGGTADRGATIEFAALFKAADAYLYQAKTQGRDRAVASRSVDQDLLDDVHRQGLLASPLAS